MDSKSGNINFITLLRAPRSDAKTVKNTAKTINLALKLSLGVKIKNRLIGIKKKPQDSVGKKKQRMTKIGKPI
jgi:hypothetical protein